MAYVFPNFKSKKALKEAVANGETVRVKEMGPPGRERFLEDGTAFIEGPHYPQPHRWYGKVSIKDGKVVRVQ